jgi:UPF0755 protein
MKRLLFVLLIVAAAAGTAAYMALARVEQPFRGYGTPDQVVSVPPGAGTASIGERLVANGVVRDLVTFRLALWRTGGARQLKAGDYRFNRPMSAREVVEKIVRGEVDQVAVTFREGLTIDEMGAVFEASGLGTAGEFVQAAGDPSLIRAIDPLAPDLEGYLFPDTYAVARGTSAAQLVKVMVDRFSQVLTPALRQAADAQGASIRQLVTLASLVEKETARGDERATIAAVYRNRLAIKMGLQCDPTVIYALQKAGRFDGNLRRADLTFDSPYNTYRYPGLPPGPIAAPGKASLEAAAQPADVDYLYFVSRNDGSHAFARSLAEHNRNVQTFQVRYFRERRAREGR